jgi:hypothetical protein
MTLCFNISGHLRRCDKKGARGNKTVHLWEGSTLVLLVRNDEGHSHPELVSGSVLHYTKMLK